MNWRKLWSSWFLKLLYQIFSQPYLNRRERGIFFLTKCGNQKFKENSCRNFSEFDDDSLEKGAIQIYLALIFLINKRIFNDTTTWIQQRQNLIMIQWSFNNEKKNFSLRTMIPENSSILMYRSVTTSYTTEFLRLVFIKRRWQICPASWDAYLLLFWWQFSTTRLLTKVRSLLPHIYDPKSNN